MTVATNTDGAALLEYGMLAALIPVVCIGAVTLVGGTINAMFNSINAAFTAAGLAP